MTDVWAALPGGAQLAVAFLFALFPLVLVHELGHFVAAKLNRVRVDEFGVGFPPRIWRMATIGETEYTVNLLPVGGFVRLAGEDDPTVPGAFAARSRPVRTAVLVAGPIANLALASAMLSGMALAEPVPEIVPGVAGSGIVQVDPDSPAAAAGVQAYDIVVAIDGHVLATGDPASDLDHAGMVALQRATSASHGGPMELTLLRGAERLEVAAVAGGVETVPSDLPGVAGRQVVSAPAGSGLEAGDVLLVGAGPSGGRRTTVLRGLGVVKVVVTPRPDPRVPDKWVIGVGINAPVVPVRLGVAGALVHGARWTGSLTRMMLEALTEMARGRRAVDLRGPLGISEISRQAIEMGWRETLALVALLSINLAIINLLPFPALDGGRLLFVAAEAVRGRRMEPSREQLVHLIGFVLVLALMAVLTYFDWIRPSPGAAP